MPRLLRAPCVKSLQLNRLNQKYMHFNISEVEINFCSLSYKEKIKSERLTKTVLHKKKFS